MEMTFFNSRTESQRSKASPHFCNIVGSNSKHQLLIINLILVTGGGWLKRMFTKLLLIAGKAKKFLHSR